jgi:hypothetical protein
VLTLASRESGEYALAEELILRLEPLGHCQLIRML